MRRLLFATILGAALVSPAYAADATGTTTPALVVTPAMLAAVEAAAPAASPDFATRSSFSHGRPTLLPALYAASAALQGYDAYSTLTVLKNGGREANPFMKNVTKSPAAFIAVKAGVTAATIMAAERLWKDNHRVAAIGAMVVSNVAMGMVAAHNSRVLSTLK